MVIGVMAVFTGAIMGDGCQVRGVWRGQQPSVTVSSVFYPDERSIKAYALAGAGSCRARGFDTTGPRQ